MNITLWILQVLLGVFFTGSGIGKAFCFNQAIWEGCVRTIPWLAGPSVPQGLFIFIGVAEFLGGIGLVLPALTKVSPKLTPAAAAGLTTVMILASGFHLMRAEFGFMALTVFLAAILAFIAYGRFVLKPIPEEALTTKAFLKGIAAIAVAFLLCYATWQSTEQRSHPSGGENGSIKTH